MVLETNMSQYFNETIYNDIQQDEMSFATIEWTGPTDVTRQRALAHVFSPEQQAEAVKRIGSAPLWW